MNTSPYPQTTQNNTEATNSSNEDSNVSTQNENQTAEIAQANNNNLDNHSSKGAPESSSNTMKSTEQPTMNPIEALQPPSKEGGAVGATLDTSRPTSTSSLDENLPAVTGNEISIENAPKQNSHTNTGCSSHAQDSTKTETTNAKSSTTNELDSGEVINNAAPGTETVTVVMSKYTYHDYAKEKPPVNYSSDMSPLYGIISQHTVRGSRSTTREPNFPLKLHAMLSRPEFEDIISWMDHGRSWRVFKCKMFEDQVIPLYFKHTKYSSFARQVSGWGFRRITQGQDYNSYYHELFLRGRPYLCERMRRPPKDEKFVQLKPEEEPNFYEMEPVGTDILSKSKSGIEVDNSSSKNGNSGNDADNSNTMEVMNDSSVGSGNQASGVDEAQSSSVSQFKRRIAQLEHERNVRELEILNKIVHQNQSQGVVGQNNSAQIHNSHHTYHTMHPGPVISDSNMMNNSQNDQPSLVGMPRQVYGAAGMRQPAAPFMDGRQYHHSMHHQGARQHQMRGSAATVNAPYGHHLGYRQYQMLGGGGVTHHQPAHVVSNSQYSGGGGGVNINTVNPNSGNNGTHYNAHQQPRELNRQLQDDNNLHNNGHQMNNNSIANNFAPHPGVNKNHYMAAPVSHIPVNSNESNFVPCPNSSNRLPAGAVPPNNVGLPFGHSGNKTMEFRSNSYIVEPTGQSVNMRFDSQSGTSTEGNIIGDHSNSVSTGLPHPGLTASRHPGGNNILAPQVQNNVQKHNSNGHFNSHQVQQRNMPNQMQPQQY